MGTILADRYITVSELKRSPGAALVVVALAVGRRDGDVYEQMLLR